MAILITWSLATGYFPYTHEELARQTYWMMGAAGALGLFRSVVLHELAHAWVARRHGLPMKGITLFIFGGVAEMTRSSNSRLMVVEGERLLGILALKDLLQFFRPKIELEETQDAVGSG